MGDLGPERILLIVGLWVALSVPLALVTGRLLRSASGPSRLIEEIETYLRRQTPASRSWHRSGSLAAVAVLVLGTVAVAGTVRDLPTFDVLTGAGGTVVIDGTPTSSSVLLPTPSGRDHDGEPAAPPPRTTRRSDLPLTVATTGRRPASTGVTTNDVPGPPAAADAAGDTPTVPVPASVPLEPVAPPATSANADEAATAPRRTMARPSIGFAPGVDGHEDVGRAPAPPVVTPEPSDLAEPAPLPEDGPVAVEPSEPAPAPLSEDGPVEAEPSEAAPAPLSEDGPVEAEPNPAASVLPREPVVEPLPGTEPETALPTLLDQQPAVEAPAPPAPTPAAVPVLVTVEPADPTAVALAN